MQKESVEQKQGSWILSATREDLVSILDNLPCGVAVLGSPFGKALYINNNIVESLGYSLADTPSTTALYKKALPDRKARSNAYRMWKNVVREGGHSDQPVVRPYLCGDGVVRVFEHRAVVLRKDLIVNLWIDVTRREGAEARLRDSESRFRSVFESSSDPFILLDDNRVVSCNQATLRMFGCEDKARIIGATMEELSPAKQAGGSSTASRVRSLFRAVHRSGSHRCEWTILGNGGQEIPVEISIALIMLEGRNLLLAVLRDITDWKKAQQNLRRAKADLENKVAERTSSLAAVNRQLKKEINARKKTEQKMRKSREELRSLSEHLQRIREDGSAHIAREVHDQLGQVLSAVAIDLACLRKGLAPRRNGKLLEQIQDIEGRIGDTMRSVRKICRKLRPPILDDFGLPAAMEWHLREFQERTGIRCTADIDEEMPDHEKEHELVLFRIYQEAMANIFRHANATRVEVTLKCQRNRLVLKVKDNGKGITAEQIANPLSLGILGIRERVRFWGGKSVLSGVPGKGTTIKVSLPLHRPRRLKERAPYTDTDKDWWTQ